MLSDILAEGSDQTKFIFFMKRINRSYDLLCPLKGAKGAEQQIAENREHAKRHHGLGADRVNLPGMCSLDHFVSECEQLVWHLEAAVAISKPNNKISLVHAISHFPQMWKDRVSLTVAAATA